MEPSLKKLTKYTNYLLGSLIVLLGAHLISVNTTSKTEAGEDESIANFESILLPPAHADVPATGGDSTGDGCGDGGGGGGCGF